MPYRTACTETGQFLTAESSQYLTQPETDRRSLLPGQKRASVGSSTTLDAKLTLKVPAFHEGVQNKKIKGKNFGALKRYPRRVG